MASKEMMMTGSMAAKKMDDCKCTWTMRWHGQDVVHWGKGRHICRPLSCCAMPEPVICCSMGRDGSLDHLCGEAAGRRFECHQLALLNLATTTHITKDKPLGSFAEKDGAIVNFGTMQDVDDDHLSTYNAVKIR